MIKTSTTQSITDTVKYLGYVSIDRRLDKIFRSFETRYNPSGFKADFTDTIRRLGNINKPMARSAQTPNQLQLEVFYHV